MRKHKSVVAILLAVMMIFTFMPTMAFANVVTPDGETGHPLVEGTWGTGFTTVSTENYGSYNTRRRLNPGTYQIVAQLDDTNLDPSATFPTVKDVWYYDLTGAEINMKDQYGQTDFEALFDKNWKLNNPSLKLKAPETVYNYGKLTAEQKSKVMDTFAGYNISVKITSAYTSGSLSEQNVTLEATLVPNREIKGDNDAPYVNAAKITKTVKVEGAKSAYTQTKFYRDEEKETNLIPTELNREAPKDNPIEVFVPFSYTGSAHKVVVKEVSGYPVTWTKLNKSTGMYESSTGCPTVTEMGDEETAMALIKWSTPYVDGSVSGTTTHTCYVKFHMYVFPAIPATFSFNPDGNYKESDVIVGRRILKNDKYMYSVTEGETYDPYDYIVVVPGDEDSKVEKEAVKANEAELKAYFKDFYEIKITKKAAYPGYEYWTIIPRELTATEKQALNKKYDKLLKTFGINFWGQPSEPRQTEKVPYNETWFGLEEDGLNGTMYVMSIVNDKDDDISFEGQTKYVYSGKKTTKKGVLKKKQTITVTATADSGNAITYVATKKADGKITVSASGKITVKKGLKMGTYTVTVKAKTKAGNGYKAAKEKQTYTIVVKK